MSEYLDAIFDGIEEGFKIITRIQKLSKQYEKLNPEPIYIDSDLYKGKDDNTGETSRTPHKHVSGEALAIDMVLDSKGVYRPKQEISDPK